MKYLAIIAALAFTGFAMAVDCTDCHEKIDVTVHTEAEASIATCNDCHDFEGAHTLDMEMHTPDLTIAECADCHE
ncbi:cytochrome c3 family protein [Shewanella sp. YLB-07]|uniref:cytochrome c3 family protein n=1 Tax=Shewanella sp. YLB-07 TaxID=2601268 RepID=UPI00128CCB40|nr:cytochrome c3 family protein [Shewanella sp. YLB-07]MPY26598.1 hypothetical protein [Shewanella sp. YLB-07]